MPSIARTAASTVRGLNTPKSASALATAAVTMAAITIRSPVAIMGIARKSATTTNDKQ